jgi:biotin carboxyl carrier protein
MRDRERARGRRRRGRDRGHVVRAALLALVLAACTRTDADLDLAPVERADLVIAVDVTGALEAVDSTDVRAPTFAYHTSFKIAWLVPDGGEVKAGDKVVAFAEDELDRNLEGLHGDAAEQEQRLEGRHHKIALAQREQDLRLLQTETDAKKAKLQVDVPPDLVAAIEMRTRKLDDELAQIALEQAKADAGYARESAAADIADLSDVRDTTLRKIADAEHYKTLMTIVSPRAGTIVYEPRFNDKLKVGDSIYENDPVVHVVGLDAMIGNGRVDEIDVGRLAVRQPISLRLDAFPDVEVRGSVQSITTNVQRRSPSDPSAVVQVKLAIEPTHGIGLRPGMRFHGTIETERIRDVVQIPADAAFVGPDGPFAYRETSAGVERVSIKLGRRSADRIQVLTGLSAGDRVSRVEPDQEAP